MSHNTPDSDMEAYASVIHGHIKEDKQTKVIATLCMLSEKQRQRVVSYKINDNTALCAAVLLKRTDLVEYLITKCGADVNERGIYREVEPNKFNIIVPPLWCAAVTGQIEIVTILISHGADINGWSDTESTPVRVACYENDLPMVKMLVEKGANIFLANIYGVTCLMNSVRCSNITRFLISKGANVNDTDSSGSTALHYAAKEGHVESTRLLLQQGSDWIILNHTKWTALMLAAYNGHDLVVQVFIDCGCLHQVQEAYALLGCHFVKEDVEKARCFWEKSSNLLTKFPIYKYVSQQYSNIARIALSSANGINLNELFKGEIDLADKDKLYMKALLIYIGILGENHEDTIYEIRYRGAVYADTNLYQRCIDLWKYAYVLLLDKKDFLENDTVWAATSLTDIFCKLQIAWQNKNTEDKIKLTDIMDVFILMKNHIEHCEMVLNVRPVNISAINNYKFLLLSVLHIINVFRCVEKYLYQTNEFYKLLSELISKNIKTHEDHTLLHLAVDPKSSTVNGDSISHLPSLGVINILLECGIDANQIDKDGNTALFCSVKYAIEEAVEEHN